MYRLSMGYSPLLTELLDDLGMIFNYIRKITWDPHVTRCYCITCVYSLFAYLSVLG